MVKVNGVAIAALYLEGKIMPLMEVTLQQRFAQQRLVNRFNYLASGTPASVSFSFALTSALGAIESAGAYPDTGLMCLIAAIQSTQLVFDQIIVRDVYSTTDFYALPFVAQLSGAIAGSDTLSPTSAIGFRSNRTRSDIRSGQKRFSGIPESATTAGGAIESTWLAGQVGDLAEALGTVVSYLDEAQTLTFSPVIVGKQCYDPTDDTECDELTTRKAYRYYPTFAEQADHLMESIVWDAHPQIRTQVTRQYGRGI